MLPTGPSESTALIHENYPEFVQVLALVIRVLFAAVFQMNW